jgi:putative transcriptional regulator
VKQLKKNPTMESGKKATVGTRIIQGLQEFVETLEQREPVTEKFTCRQIELDLRPTPYDPEMVKETRKLLGASQSVFARFLGVSIKTVRAWEQGINTPNDIACRFMDEIRRNPPYWLERLRDAAVAK